MNTKSILDGVPVKETNMDPQNLGKFIVGAPGMKLEPTQLLSIVGHCPCGAPIYGYKKLPANVPPVAQYSCDCRGERHEVKDLKGQFRTT